MTTAEAWAIVEVVAKSTAAGLLVAGLGTLLAAWVACRHLEVGDMTRPYKDPVSGKTRMPRGER